MPFTKPGKATITRPQGVGKDQAPGKGTSRQQREAWEDARGRRQRSLTDGCSGPGKSPAEEGERSCSRSGQQALALAAPEAVNTATAGKAQHDLKSRGASA